MRKNNMLLKIAFVICYSVLVVLSEKCRTPNDEEAECISIRSCPILCEALVSFQAAAFEFIKKSQCGNSAADLMVCCGSSASYVASTTPASVKNKTSLLPSRRFCGYQRFDDYFHTEHNGPVLSIDEFPWLVGLVYEEEGVLIVTCLGSLISDKYVLTAAHCIVTRSHLVGVRLGEYIAAQDKYCINTGRFGNECTDPIVDFGIEEFIVHPQFSPRLKHHDISLIRLNGTVTYTDFIRPICLPFPGTNFAKIGDLLYVSGWGRSVSANETGVKNKIAVELLPNERCMEELNLISSRSIIYNQTCTSETRNSPISCVADSGGPVMFFRRNQWHQEGIILYGLGCGTGVLSVNTKVVTYLDWIVESIRP